MNEAQVVYNPLSTPQWEVVVVLPHARYNIVILTVIAQLDSYERAAYIAELINKREPDVPE